VDDDTMAKGSFDYVLEEIARLRDFMVFKEI
jgi:hypothetical protein